MPSVIKPATHILKYHYADHDGWLGLFAYQILRAGHIRTGPDHRIERRDVPGHEFLFCLNGRGVITLGGTRHEVTPNELAWLPVREPHAHRPHPDTPWELLWLRVDSPNLSRLMGVLAVHENPIFQFARPQEIQTLFEAVLQQLESATLAAQASCERLVASLVEHLLISRGDRVLETKSLNHTGLRRLMARIHAHYNDPWDVEKLAATCGVSRAHLFRLFHAAFQTTPLTWLRNYRIAQAKRLLVETSEPVSVIAARVGYTDPFYFSRDFKKRTGRSPTAFRAAEGWHYL